MIKHEPSNVDFSFEGDPGIIRESAQRALSVIPQQIAGKLRARLVQALQEILLNAWEHGVLGIRAYEKERLLEEGLLESERRSRHMALRGSERLIRVESSFIDGIFHCDVTDPGQGFSWRDVAERNDVSADQLAGRGLTLIRDTFDTVRWNETGNVISVTWSEVNEVV